MTSIGIMQGRLVPPVRGIQAFPRDNWRDEFSRARDAQLDFIEWIYDEYGADVNPLMSDKGIKEIRALSQSTGVAVNSICADYFMDQPLLKCAKSEQEHRAEHLILVFENAKKLGVTRVVLPFVDASSMDSEAEEDAFVSLLNDRILPVAERAQIEVHLETSLPPKAVAALLARIPHPLFWINYDSGNSSSLGYKPEEEFQTYGKRIGSFHVKDRKLKSTTVPLGSGDTDFPALAKCLRAIGYQRPFVLQVARGTAGDETGWAIKNREFTQMHLLSGNDNGTGS